MAKRRTSKISASTLALLALGSGLLAVRAPAGQGSDEKARAVRRGKVLYGLHCQTCHGEEGRGDGVLAEHLKVEPSDLRALGRRPGGYSEEWLSQVIDGREEIRGHGTREMPVWGIGLREPDRMADQEADVEGRIEDLVAYVLSIQDPR
jgi:mono/diheme cytochrome c family protein